MARIRSVHPSLFTDEVFMAASMPARLLMIGLWTEADDQGVFEWKPLSLKARLLPADNADMPLLLAELVSANVVMKFEADGKAYGAIRNFCKFQRPQKANSLYPLPETIASYVEISARVTRDEREQSRSSTRKFDAMEDGGGRMKEEAPPAGSNEPLGVAGASAPSPTKASRKSKKTPFPEGWEPDERDITFARSKGMDDSQIARSGARFRGKKMGSTSLDWHLEWDGWVIEDCTYLGIKPSTVVPLASDAVFVAADDPAFPALKAKFCEVRGKPPPIDSGGWYFERSWLPAA